MHLLSMAPAGRASSREGDKKRPFLSKASLLLEERSQVAPSAGKDPAQEQEAALLRSAKGEKRRAKGLAHPEEMSSLLRSIRAVQRRDSRPRPSRERAAVSWSGSVAYSFALSLPSLALYFFAGPGHALLLPPQGREVLPALLSFFLFRSLYALVGGALVGKVTLTYGGGYWGCRTLLLALWWGAAPLCAYLTPAYNQAYAPLDLACTFLFFALLEIALLWCSYASLHRHPLHQDPLWRRLHYGGMLAFVSFFPAFLLLFALQVRGLAQPALYPALQGMAQGGVVGEFLSLALLYLTLAAFWPLFYRVARRWSSVELMPHRLWLTATLLLYLLPTSSFPRLVGHEKVIARCLLALYGVSALALPLYLLGWSASLSATLLKKKEPASLYFFSPSCQAARLSLLGGGRGGEFASSLWRVFASCSRKKEPPTTPTPLPTLLGRERC